MGRDREGETGGRVGSLLRMAPPGHQFVFAVGESYGGVGEGFADLGWFGG